MKARLGWIAAAWLGAMIPVTGAGALAWTYMEETRNRWEAYGEAAFRRAEAEQKPLFIFFYADWCPWCRKYEIEALETEAVRQRLEQDFVPVAVDVDQQRRLFRRYQGRVVPMTLILAPDGRKLLRFQGFVDASALLRALDWALEQARSVPGEAWDTLDPERCCPVENNGPGGVR